jgi:DNA polymerase-3 subunit epsilon
MLTLANSLPDCRLPAVARPLSVTPMRVCRRDGYVHVDSPAPYLAALAQGIHTSVDVAPYVGLLDVAVADLRMTATERRELGVLAADLGLDERAVNRAHREFLNGLIDAAVEDSIVTDDEHDQLCRVVALLDIDIEHVARRTDSFRASTKAIELMAGLSVCFTGEARDTDGGQFDRARQTSLAEQHGLVVTKSVTKKGPDLVVAADGDSRSEKARKARQNGIPVATFSAFVDALRTGGSLTVAHLSSAGLALVCVDCGDSWLAPRRVSQPVCAACSSSSLLGAKTGQQSHRIAPGSADREVTGNPSDADLHGRVVNGFAAGTSHAESLDRGFVGRGDVATAEMISTALTHFIFIPRSQSIHSVAVSQSMRSEKGERASGRRTPAHDPNNSPLHE